MRRPSFIAQQARAPSGMLGRVVAFIMARETLKANERAIDALEVRPGEHVLDIGCGNGLSLMRLAELTQGGRVAGVDPSELMAERAVWRNRAHVKAWRVDVAIAGVETLPFPADTFDKAMSVHTLYFWNDLSIAFAEIARVLKPGGRLALLFRTTADQGAVKNFPSDVYRFRSLAEVAAALTGAGLSVETQGEAGEERALPALLIAHKRKGGR
jgi:ubiquinone/menaquinone biosynthesis C-methylase UbiE